MAKSDFLSDKQFEYWRNATRRWNIKSGATRSGKTYADYFMIPKRIRACKDQGLIVLLGNTQATLNRNVLEPMRNIYGTQLVPEVISSDNTITLFGKKTHVIGADRRSQVARIQGAGIEYAYGDEVTTWHEDVFTMLKSRLDKPGACFDGTCNPDRPTHWFKKFLDSSADIYHQHYGIDDNPYLDADFIRNLKKEYAGTVYYDRFILGRWVSAEGAIYINYANSPKKHQIGLKALSEKKGHFISIGVDFGGNKSKTKFVASLITQNFKQIIAIAEHEIKGGKGEIDAERLSSEFDLFIQTTTQSYPQWPIRYVWADSAEQYLINTLRSVSRQKGFQFRIADSKKRPVKERIIATCTLLNTGRMLINESCTMLDKGLREAVWEGKGEDVRLDDFTSDIDILDAFEYSWEAFLHRLLPQ